MIVVYILFLVMAIPDHPLWGSYIGPLTIVKYLGILCLSYALFYRATCRGSLKLFSAPQTNLFLVLCVIAVFSCLNGPDGFNFNGPFSAYISFLMMFFLLIALIESRNRLRLTVIMGFGSIALASVYLIKEWRVGASLYGSGYRPGWVTGDPNYFALSGVLLFPLAVFTFIQPQKKIDRLIAAGALALISTAMILTASRGGFIGLGIAALLMMRNAKSKLKVALVVAAVLGLVLAFMPASTMQRMTDPSAGDRESSDIRLLLWSAGWKMMLDHPLTGVGVSQFGVALPQYIDPEHNDRAMLRVPHNTYISYGAEMGFPGLVVFVLIMIVSIFRMESLRRRARSLGDEFVSNLATAASAGLAGAAVSLFFLSATQSKPLWFLVAFSAVLPRFLADAKSQVDQGLDDSVEQSEVGHLAIR